MNFAKLILSCTFIGLLMCLAGCAKKSNYKPTSLISLKQLAHIDYEETKEQVTVCAKKCTKDDCDYVFGDRADYIIGEKNPLQPIQLCIENKSESLLLLFDSNIALPLVPTQKVIDRLSPWRFTTTATCGAIGLLGLSLFICPLIFPCAIFPSFAMAIPPYMSWVLFGAASSLITLATPCIFIADNALFGPCPEEITNCIHKTKKGKAIAIKQAKTIDMLIFVRKDEFKPTFDLTLLHENDQTKKLTFTVKLENQIIAE